MMPDCWRSYKESMIVNTELRCRNPKLFGFGWSNSPVSQNPLQTNSPPDKIPSGQNRLN